MQMSLFMRNSLSGMTYQLKTWQHWVISLFASVRK